MAETQRRERRPPSRETETGRAGRGSPWRWTGRESRRWSLPTDIEDNVKDSTVIFLSTKEFEHL